MEFHDRRVIADDQIIPVCTEAGRAMCALNKQVYLNLQKAVRENTLPDVDKPQYDTTVPHTELQKTFKRAMDPVIDVTGEVMPHSFVTSPHSSSDKKKDREKRPEVLIPNSLFANKRDMFEALQEQFPRMEYKYFIDLWHRFYWHVSIKKWIPFAKCDDCVNLRLQ